MKAARILGAMVFVFLLFGLPTMMIVQFGAMKSAPPGTAAGTTGPLGALARALRKIMPASLAGRAGAGRSRPGAPGRGAPGTPGADGQPGAPGEQGAGGDYPPAASEAFPGEGSYNGD